VRAAVRILSWLLRSCCCAATGALFGARRKLWSSAVAVSLGCAMLGSTMYTCLHHPVRLLEEFLRFSSCWWTRDPEVNSRRCLHTWPMRKGPRSSSIMAVAVFLVCDAPRAVFPMIAGRSKFLLRSSCTWKSVHYFYEPPCIFSICHSRFFALVDFLGPSSTHSCECSRAGGAGVAGSLTLR